MSVHGRIKPVERSTGTTGLVGAAPQTGAGGAFNVADAEMSTLSARVYAKATTNTLTITGKWQARNATTGSTWYDVYGPNNAANVTLVTGTGSAVSATRVIAAPRAVYSARQARFVVLTGTGVAADSPDDEFSVAYNYRVRMYERRPIIGPAGSALPISGASGTVVAGAAVSTGDLQPTTLCALVYAKAGTASLVLTGSWQVTNTPNDSNSWLAARLGHAPADVAIVTASANDTRFIEAPDSVYGYRFARYVLTTSGASAVGGSTDEYWITYQYMRPFY